MLSGAEWSKGGMRDCGCAVQCNVANLQSEYLQKGQPMKRRIYAGQFLRSLRETHHLKQGALARQMGISTPYLSQLENDSRPLTMAMADRLRGLFPIDWADMAEAPVEEVVTALLEAAHDPMLRDHLPPAQIERVAEQFPQFAQQFLRLYQWHRRDAQRLEAMDEAMGADTLSGGRLPWEEVRDWFHQADNYVHRIDAAAETMASVLRAGAARLEGAALERWFAGRGITLVYHEDAPVRAYDEAAQILRLKSGQPQESLRFQLAFQMCSIALAQDIAATVEAADLSGPTARNLLAVGLANYAAGALLMPYRPFREAAASHRHDIDRLCQIFGASFEQVCHRLSTLQRPHARGIPLFFCRIDMAGNITKRHSANGLQFARFGGACPLWVAHEAVANPDRILLQIAEMPEGRRYVFFARGLVKPADHHFQPPRRYGLAVGFEIGLAGHFVYGDSLNLACEEAVVPIGVSCRICSRLDCAQRAYPPNEKQIDINTNQRGFIPYRIME
jgi:predicted transcriptional regulator/transcriptional regulator with XRE-family HTH domain